jgi:YD repeat-containing protein
MNGQSVTDARGATTNVIYGDPRGLATQLNYTVPQGSTIPVPATLNFQYDNLGNRTQMNDGSGSTSYNYDSLSQLTSETRSFSGLSGSFTIGYEYSLSGELKKITDPTNVAINYGFDRIGRLSNVTGSGNLYSGVSNYASDFGYRAWGGLKSVNYSNSTSTSVTYNNRLQPSSYSISGVKRYETSNPQPEGGTFTYYNDGMLKYSTDSRTDISAGLGLHNRAFAYDHQGRIKEAYSFYQADNFANGTTGGYPTVPFRHSYAYDAFSNTTSQTGSLWSEDDNVTNTFNSQNRNTAWSYDADGRVITTNEPSPNGLTWTPVTFGYNAAGRQTSMGQTTSRPRFNNPNLIDTTVTTRNQTYDGNGVVAKSVFTEQFNSGTPTSATTYYLRSSVTGTFIAEYDGAGTRTKASVYAGGTVIAEQLPTGTTPQVFWQHVNPVTGDGLNTDASGVATNRTTPNPDGVDVGDSDPFAPPAGAGEPPDPSQSAIDHMVAQMIPGYGGPKCYVNGALSGCHWAGSLLNSESAAVEYTIYSRQRGFFRVDSPIENLGLGLYGNETPPTWIRTRTQIIGFDGNMPITRTTETDSGDEGYDIFSLGGFDGGSPNTIAQLRECLFLSVPLYKNLHSAASTLLTSTFGDGAQAKYNSWSIYERAVFVNTAVAAAGYGAEFNQAKFERFYVGTGKGGPNTMGKILPFGFWFKGHPWAIIWYSRKHNVQTFRKYRLG